MSGIRRGPKIQARTNLDAEDAIQSPVKYRAKKLCGLLRIPAARTIEWGHTHKRRGSVKGRNDYEGNR